MFSLDADRNKQYKTFIYLAESVGTPISVMERHQTASPSVRDLPQR
jgi:hypothetical protein